jgi:hypothetical protein
VDGVAYERHGMPRIAGRKFDCDQGERGYDSRAQDAGCGVAQTVTMLTAVIVTGADMRMKVHCLNSTRRTATGKSAAAAASSGMQLHVRFSLRAPETQLTHPRRAPTMKSMAGFLEIQEGRQNRGSGTAPPCPKTAPN